MLDVLGHCLATKFLVQVPKSVDGLCSSKVLTMVYMEGKPLSSLLSTWSEDSSDVSSKELIDLMKSFGFMIIRLGTFHSDPHPGNILCGTLKGLTLIDFGQVKILPENTRILYAHLIIALYRKRAGALSKILKLLGVELTTEDPNLVAVIATILFDTRMDFPEARISILDEDFPSELRTVRINRIPTDVFMIIRVIAIFRGIFTTVGADIHAAELWLEYAEETIAESKIKYNFTSEETIRAKRDVVSDMKYLSAWLGKNNLPCNRECIASFASAEVFSVSDLLEAYQQGKYAFTRVLAYFNEHDRVKLLALVQSGSTVTRDLLI